MKVRADVLLQQRGLVESRTKAQALILAGSVVAGEHRVEKPGQLLDDGIALRLKEQLKYVSRGGLKLEAALDHFALSQRIGSARTSALRPAASLTCCCSAEP